MARNSTKKTVTPKKTTKRKQVEWKQPDLFEAAAAAAAEPIRITVEIPSGGHLKIENSPTGATATVGGSSAKTTPNVSPELLFKTLGEMTRDEIRAGLLKARLTAASIINITTVMHGALYPLAAIGGKVTGRRKR